VKSVKVDVARKDYKSYKSRWHMAHTLSFHYAWSTVKNALKLDQCLVLLCDSCLLYPSTVLDRMIKKYYVGS